MKFFMALAAAALLAAPTLAQDSPPAPNRSLHDQRAEALAKSVHHEFDCTQCHPHGVDPVLHPKMEPVDCGHCHTLEAAAYGRSIHGQMAAQGNRDVPTCASCHGAHDIARIADPASHVSSANLPQTCATCHESEAISKKYGIPGRRLSTYTSSFHGTANRFGEIRAANCASCHGNHEILPSADPRSPVNPDNLAATCGRCHPGASENFARGKIHVEATRENSKGVWAVRTFYYWIIGIIIGFFILHILLDLIGRARRRREVKP